MSITKLPLKNLIHKPVRTTALVLIALFMTAAIFGGQVAAASLQNGLTSLEQRLGADIIVVPEDAQAKTDLENILLQGTPGYFYMDKSVQDKIANIDGVELVSPQYFLVSANAECCTVQVQIIGFDEDSDFTIKPWLRQSYTGTLGENEIIVGSSLSTRVGHTLKLYGVECKAVGKLDATGTGLDTAIYTTPETVKTLIKASQQKGIGVLAKQSPEDVISSVYIKVRDGYDISEVAGNINLSVGGVQAVRTRSMITSTADRLSVISNGIRVLIAAVWVLAAVILTAAFTSLVSTRKKEFAVLRISGFSRRQLAALVLSESVAVCAVGAVTGLALACAAVLPFGSLIEQKTGLPYLSPGVFKAAVYALTAALAVIATGTLASLFAAYKLSHNDTGRILKEGD